MILDPYAPEAISNPIPFWARLRAEAPVLEVPGSPGYFYVSRHEDVRRICNAPELFTSELLATVQLGADGRPRLTTAHTKDAPHGRVLGAADGEVHDRHRRLLARAFSASRMRTFETWVRERARALVREAPLEFDAMQVLAGPLPVQAMLHLLGLPAGEWRRLGRWSDSVVFLMGGLADAETFERCSRDVEELQAHLASALEPDSPEAAAAPGDSVLPLLLQAVEDGTIESWEANGLLLQLVVGGSDTTAGLIGASIHQLALRPDLAERLREEPELLAPFIEETNRLAGPAIGSYRRVTSDTTLAGVAIPAGSTVTILWSSANRDERAFADPDRFDLARPDLKANLGFGHGTHFCVGAALARLETRAMIEAVLEARRTIELTVPPSEIAPEPRLFLRKLAKLPVRMAI